MHFHDLLRNRKSKARILAKSLMGPVGVKALEDLVESVGTDAGAVIVDHDLDVVLHASAEDTHTAVRRRERSRVLNDVIDHLAQGIATAHHERALIAALEFDRNPYTVVTFDLVCDGNDGSQKLHQIYRNRIDTLHFGVEAAGIRNIGDQPIQALHIVLDDGKKSASTVFGFHQRQGLDSGAQRGERVLEFVRDVGSKALHRLDATVHGCRHL